MKHIALILILLAIVLRVGAQNYSGHVTDANGKPLESVSVMLLDGKGKIVKFAKTDSKGVFTVKLPEGKTATQLSLVCVGYARMNLPLSKYKDGSTTAMEEKVEEIREVKVSPEKFRIQGDTLFLFCLGIARKAGPHHIRRYCTHTGHLRVCNGTNNLSGHGNQQVLC